MDPQRAKQPAWSSYKYALDNPIMFLDPNGETEFYSTDGKWIGTDGVDNKLIATVTNKQLVKQIKRDTKNGKLAAEVSIGTKAFDKSENMYVIHADVLSHANSMLNKSMTQKGQKGEFANGMCLEGSRFVPMLEEDSYSPGTYQNAELDMSSIPEGDVSIHSHLTGYDKETGEHYRADVPSESQFLNSADMTVFKNFETNIIVGEVGDIVNQQPDPRMPRDWNDSQRRPGICIYDSGRSTKPMVTYSGSRANVMLSTDKGKLGRQFDRQRDKQEKGGL